MYLCNTNISTVVVIFSNGCMEEQRQKDSHLLDKIIMSLPSKLTLPFVNFTVFFGVERTYLFKTCTSCLNILLISLLIISVVR